jgi:ferredoxin--NADP+ reductase
MRGATGHVELPPPEISRLRAAHYNAALSAVLPIHAELRILRVGPDAGLPPFAAGQFLTLGLGYWESRVGGVDEEQIDAAHMGRLAKRAYSISCSLLDHSGVLRRATDFPYLEFYVALVRHSRRRPPSLTPRLFALQPGACLFVESHAAGNYTLGCLRAAENVFFFATGTGEAPHNAMIAELLTQGHRGKVVSVVSVRYLRDAAYRERHEELMRRYSNYRYYVLSTREPQSDVPWISTLNGRCHLQDLILTRQLERHSRIDLDPANTQVFLCGNPGMIGAQHATGSSAANVKSGSMLELLMERGFRIGESGQSGNLHFERYW